jgi:HPt (histidine-containing phosphotransfer) domain-containing protein
VSAALSKEDFDAAERIAHSVKGVAGNLGVSHLFLFAAELETALQSRTGVDSALQKFTSELARMTALLKDASAPRTGGASSTDATQAAAHGSKLAALLAASSGEAVEYFDAHRAAVLALFARGGSAAFEKALGEFDFEAALHALRSAAVERSIILQGENA